MADLTTFDLIWPWRYWPRVMKFTHNRVPHGPHLPSKFRLSSSSGSWDLRGGTSAPLPLHTGPIARSSTTWVKKSNFVDVQWNLYQFVQKWSYYIAVVFVFQHNCYFMAKTQLKHELRNRLDRTRPPHSSTTYLWSTKTITIWGGIPHLYTSNDSSGSAEHT